MAFALIIIGLVMVVSAVRNTQGCLVQVVQQDFTGQANFLYWVAAILILGAIGYSDTLRPLSDGLLIVILLALFLTRGRQGLFTNLTQALGSSGSVSGAISAITGG